MFVISDAGDAMVNLDQVFALVPTMGEGGQVALLAWGQNNVVLAVGSGERIAQALDEITGALRLHGELRPAVLDLRSRIGARTDLQVARLVPDGAR